MFDKHGHVFWVDVCVFIFLVFFIYLAALSRGVFVFFVCVVFLGGRGLWGVGGLEAPYLPVQFSGCLCA